VSVFDTNVRTSRADSDSAHTEMALIHRKKNKDAEDGDAEAEKQRNDQEEKKSE
jgi:hypothetical protein